MSTSANCSGTLIDEDTILTAGHCRLDKINFKFNGKEYDHQIEPNSFYPTYESMFSVYLGVHNKSMLNKPPVVKMNIKKFILVYLIYLVFQFMS